MIVVYEIEMIRSDCHVGLSKYILFLAAGKVRCMLSGSLLSWHCLHALSSFMMNAY